MSDYKSYMGYEDTEPEIGEVTQEMLDNFSSDISDYFEDRSESDGLYSDSQDFYSMYNSIEEEEKSIEEIRAEREERQRLRRQAKRRERRSSFINSFMPFTAFMLLVCTVSYFNAQQFGLVVSYKDKQIALVENAGVVEEAVSIIDSRIINKSLDTIEDEPKYTVAVVNNGSKLQTSAELSRTIIESDKVLTDNVCGVFADGSFVGAVESEDEAKKVLDSLLTQKKKEYENEYKDNDKIRVKVEKVKFNSNVYIETGLFAGDSVVSSKVLKDRLVNNIDLSYTVIVSEEKDVKLRFKTEYVVDGTKPEGYEQIIVKGKIGEGTAAERITYVDGVQIDKETVKVTASVKPEKQVVCVSAENENAQDAKSVQEYESSKKTDTANADTTVNNTVSEGNTNDDTDNQNSVEATVQQPKQFIWPAVNCYDITNDFGYVGEKLHKGIDISGPCADGQPIVAAASGYVTVAVLDYGSENYGCYLIIDHGNGYQTKYAQCSDIYVTPGTYVEQGEVIAAVGSTGDSTGAHLHFEIIEYGEYVNPASYLY